MFFFFFLMIGKAWDSVDNVFRTPSEALKLRDELKIERKYELIGLVDETGNTPTGFVRKGRNERALNGESEDHFVTDTESKPRTLDDTLSQIILKLHPHIAQSPHGQQEMFIAEQPPIINGQLYIYPRVFNVSTYGGHPEIGYACLNGDREKRLEGKALYVPRTQIAYVLFMQAPNNNDFLDFINKKKKIYLENQPIDPVILPLFEKGCVEQRDENEYTIPWFITDTLVPSVGEFYTISANSLELEYHTIENMRTRTNQRIAKLKSLPLNLKNQILRINRTNRLGKVCH